MRFSVPETRNTAPAGDHRQKHQQHQKNIGPPVVDRTRNIDAAVRWRAAGDVYLELWRACLHEYAYQAIAFHFDVPSSVHIERNPGGGAEERHYVGQCRMYSLPEGMPRRIIGLVGIVAECIDEDGDLEVDNVADFLFFDAITLSGTDAHLASGYSYADIALCFRLVRRLWPQIVSRATERFEFEQRRAA